jgi:hypothetical protein
MKNITTLWAVVVVIVWYKNVVEFRWDKKVSTFIEENTLIVLDPNFNAVSVISWRSVLLQEETGY